MIRLIMAIATGLYTGYLPKAPGTWGTLVALPLNLLFLQLSPRGYAIAMVTTLVLAVFTAGSAEKILDRKDPGLIVIDEIAGMLVALIAAPATPLAWFAAFLLFRLFDITKPWPVSWVDRHLNGGLGIVLDDLLAGVYAWLVLHGGLTLLALLSNL